MYPKMAQECTLEIASRLIFENEIPYRFMWKGLLA